jgi:hypothetical protein
MSLGMDKTSLHPILPEVSFQALVADSLAVPNKIINKGAYQHCPWRQSKRKGCFNANRIAKKL